MGLSYLHRALRDWLAHLRTCTADERTRMSTHPVETTLTSSRYSGVRSKASVPPESTSLSLRSSHRLPNWKTGVCLSKSSRLCLIPCSDPFWQLWRSLCDRQCGRTSTRRRSYRSCDVALVFLHQSTIWSNRKSVSSPSQLDTDDCLVDNRGRIFPTG